MTTRRESLPLTAGLRDVTLARFGDRETLRRQDLQASFERGRIDGEQRLSEQLVRQRAELMELQTGVLAALRDAVPQVIRDTERTLAALALAAARKLVADLPISSEMIEAAVREACAAVEDTADFTVLVHPEDLALLERVNSPILLPQGGRDRLRFQPSHQVSRGGCLVQTQFGVLDARRETKLARLEQALQP